MPPEQEKWEGDIFDDPRMIVARQRVILALEQGPEPIARRMREKLTGLQKCGSYPAAFQIKDGRVVRVFRNRCRCRGCPVCETLRAADTRLGLDLLASERATQGARFSLITLTMPHTRSDLAQKLICLLFAALGRFQRSAPFRKYVRGWARGIEVPWTAENGFHPHAHYLVEASMWPKEELKAQWTRSMLAVGGPFVPPHGAHVKGIKDGQRGLIEVVGYPFKVADLGTMPLAETCQLLYATKGRHLTQFCRWWSKRVASLVDQQEAERKRAALDAGIETIAFMDIWRRARHGDKASMELLMQAADSLAANARTLPVARNLLEVIGGGAALPSHAAPVAAEA